MTDRVRRRTLLTIVTLAVASYATGHAVRAQEPDGDANRLALAARLAPTDHPPLPGHPSLYWLLPDLSATRSTATRADDPATRFARGVKLIVDGDFAAGLPLVNGAMAATPLAGYAQYYTARGMVGLARLPEADTVLTALLARTPTGYLREAAQIQLADVAIARGDAPRAMDLLEDLSDEKVTAPEDVFLRLGKAAELGGATEKALKAYRTVY